MIDVLSAMARAAFKDDDFPKGESLYLRAEKPELAISMYRVRNECVYWNEHWWQLLMLNKFNVGKYLHLLKKVLIGEVKCITGKVG